MAFNSGWLKPHIEALRTYTRQGFSAAQIAQGLNEDFPGYSYTRNSIIGKCSRLGLPLGIAANACAVRTNPAPVKKPEPTPVKDYVPSAPKLKPAPIPQAAPVPRNLAFDPLPGAPPVALFDLRPDHCRWPVGLQPVCVDGSDYKLEAYCGCEAIEGRPYCAAHAATSRGAGGTLWVSKRQRAREALAFNDNSLILEAAE